jgi:MOSC domain-containing protein
MYVKELWRYPVKSLAGERVKEVFVEQLGLKGDRLIHVQREEGRLVTSRTYPRLLSLKGTLGNEGQALVNGMKWESPEALALVRAAAGPEARLVYYDGPERFDVLPLSVATDGAIEHMKIDGRRLRPNIIIGGVKDLEERNWPGRNLRIGELLVFAQRLRPRCVMTTWDPDTQKQDITVLKLIVNELDGVMSLDCSVTEPGTIHEGDRVELGK